MAAKAALHMACICLGLLLLAGPSAASRRLMGRQLAQEDGGWIEGRATWFDHPWTGSCGYGRLDGYEFGLDAVAAMPDVYKDYNSSCGRCYEVKCRGIQAISADGAVNLDRQDACLNTSKSIVVKIVDTCPCRGNEKWCCGDMNHLDLSAGAFARLAPQGKGIIGLYFRPVPCSMAFEGEGGVSREEWAAMEQSVAMGAEPAVFVNGELGLGWKKTVFGDAKRAMYTYDPSIVQFSGEEAALCGEFQQYGGFDFHAQANRTSVFDGARGVEFWVQTQAQVPNMVFRLGHILGGSCWKQQPLADAITKSTETQAGWTKVFFPIEGFDCTHEVKPADLNRLQWEARDPSGASVCVRDVRIVRDGAQPSPASSTGTTPQGSTGNGDAGAQEPVTAAPGSSVEEGGAPAPEQGAPGGK